MATNVNDTVILSKGDLAEIISTAVAAAVRAANEPNSIEQREIDRKNKEFEQAQKDRKELGLQALELMKGKLQAQKMCSHEHKNGDSHCVYVVERGGPGYIICQKNQCKIRPEPKPAQHADAQAIYDTALFNKLFQKLPGNEIFN